VIENIEMKKRGNYTLNTSLYKNEETVIVVLHFVRDSSLADISLSQVLKHKNFVLRRCNTVERGKI
jgi:hypothetical protein